MHSYVAHPRIGGSWYWDITGRVTALSHLIAYPLWFIPLTTADVVRIIGLDDEKKRGHSSCPPGIGEASYWWEKTSSKINK